MNIRKVNLDLEFKLKETIIKSGIERSITLFQTSFKIRSIKAAQINGSTILKYEVLKNNTILATLPTYAKAHRFLSAQIRVFIESNTIGG